MNAPIDLVWEVWTNPDHIKNWWGPVGFSNTIHTMDVREGGEWNLTMHGPDGADFKNKSIFKELVHHKRIVIDHISAPKFLATIEFEAQGNKTSINWHMLFESKELFMQTVKTFKADEGLKQNADKLGHYVQSKLAIWKQLKTGTGPRSSTYLNFPGNTEQAFNFIARSSAVSSMARVSSGLVTSRLSRECLHCQMLIKNSFSMLSSLFSAVTSSWQPMHLSRWE